MKRFFAIALLGLAALGLGSGRASAWWWSHCCGHKCGITLTATQYNAFSPYCLDSLHGCLPLAGLAAQVAGPECGGAACSMQGGYCLGELPAPGTITGHASAGDAVAGPALSAPVANGPQVVPPTTAQAPLPQGAPAQAWPTWGPGMVNPSGVPGYFPANMGNRPLYGQGR
jgi:hypothetical protein